MSESTSVRTVVGKIISDTRDKTRTVEVYWSRRHPVYGKVVRKRTKCQVHDENNTGKMGDWVEICQCKPMSKTKSWNLVRVVEESKQ